MTLDYSDLCKEVVPANILTMDEFRQVCAKAVFESGTICTQTEVRAVFQERWKWWETVAVIHDGQGTRWSEADASNSCLVVGDRQIMLESITCVGSISQGFITSYGLSYPCEAELVIFRITDYISSSYIEEPITIKFNGSANFFEPFTIPTLVNGESVTLRASCTYKLKLSFVSPELKLHPCWHAPACSDGHDFSHGKFYCSYIYEEGVGWKPGHIVKFQYSYRK